MTREEARKAAEVMLAYAEGKTIEYKEDIDNKYLTCVEPTFNWRDDVSNYRIKLEPKYRPFKDAEECWNEMLKHQPFGWVKDDGDYINISNIGNDDVISYNGGDCPVIILFKYLELNEHPKVTFADGTPFGIKEEE